MSGYGGETPLVKYGLSYTFESPDGTTAAVPVAQGDLFKIGGTASDGTGYKLVALVDGNDFTSSVIVMALHAIAEVGTMGAQILGNWHQIRRLNYVTGVAPTLGQSVEASGVNVRKVKGKAFDGDGIVLKVNTADLTVEVLV